jgi:hypothetical protein
VKIEEIIAVSVVRVGRNNQRVLRHMKIGNPREIRLASPAPSSRAGNIFGSR